MKKTVFLYVLLQFTLYSCYNQRAPEKLEKALAVNYPNATSVSWEQEGVNLWEASFKLHKIEYEAVFNSNGELIKREHEIGLSQIPPVVLGAVNIKFPDYKIDEVELVETQTAQFYELELKKDKLELEVTVTSKGILLSENSEADDDDR